MSDLIRPEDYAALLATTLAELSEQLRQRSVQHTGEASLPRCTARLEVLARLLADPNLVAAPGSLTAVGESLRGLLAALGDSPGRDLAYLEPGLEFLAEVLEATLARLDSGEMAGTICGDPLWLAVLSRLSTAGTPLEIMDELDACARRWEEQWCDRNLTLGQERELRRRWQTFREYGDAMFGQSSQGQVAGNVGATPSGQLLLLVESVLRREQLLQRLHAVGHDARPAASLQDALDCLRQPTRTRAILCDNLEPSHHLTRLALKKETLQQENGPLPALILVTGGSGNSAADLKRARGLGADGVWAEPFKNDPISGLFGEES